MPPSSSLHTKVEPSSVLENVNPADPLVLEAGGAEVMAVSGVTVSTTHVYCVFGPV